MRTLSKSALISAAVLAATTALAIPATADTTFTVSPGGQVSAASTGIVKAEDLDSGAVVTCNSLTAKGSVPSGSGLSGNALVTLNEAAFNGCVGPANIQETITLTGLPWKLDASSYDAATGTTIGHINGASGSLVGSDGCQATFTGPGGAAGYVEGRYTNSSGQISVDNGNLVVATVNANCPPDLIAVGDRISLTGSVTVDPKQTITSP